MRRPERLTAALLFAVLLVSLFALVRPQGNAAAAATTVTPTIVYGCGPGGTGAPFVAVTLDSQSSTTVAVTAGLITADQAAAATLSFPAVYSDATSHRPVIVNVPANPGTVKVQLVGPVTPTDQLLLQTPGDDPVAYPLPPDPAALPGGGPACDPSVTADDYGLGIPATVVDSAGTCAMDGLGTATINTVVGNTNPADAGTQFKFAAASGEVTPTIDYTELLVNITDPANPIQSGAVLASFPDTVPDGSPTTTVPAPFTVSAHVAGSYEIELVGMDGSEIVAATLSLDCSTDVPPTASVAASTSDPPTLAPSASDTSIFTAPSNTPSEPESPAPSRPSDSFLPPPSTLTTVDPSTSAPVPASSTTGSSLAASPDNTQVPSPSMEEDLGSSALPSIQPPIDQPSVSSAPVKSAAVSYSPLPAVQSLPTSSAASPAQSAGTTPGPTAGSKPVIIARRSSAKLPALANPPAITPLRILAWHRDAALVVAIDGLAVCSLVGATVWSARRR